MQENKEKVLELDYQSVPLGRNFAGRLLDLFLFLVFGVILVIPDLFIIQGNKTYQSWLTTQNDYKIESRLYKKNEEGKILKLPSYYDEVNDLTFNEKSEQMNDALVFFFEDYVSSEMNGTGKKILLDYKLDCKTTDGKALFDDEGNRVLVSSDYDSVYYSTYSSLINDKALGYLNLKKEYLDSKKKASLIYLVTIPLMFVLSYTVFYYIIPLCFSRGKRTLGMKITKTALLSVDGFSVKGGRFTLKFLFKLFIILIGSFAAVFIPVAVSITMIVVLKSHQSLSEYVTNTYLVSIEDQDVYKDLIEYRIAHQEIDFEPYMKKK